MFDTPAAVDKESGTLFLNPKLWFKLTRFQQRFVKLHEIGHYVLDTDSEEMADAYAFDHLVGTEPRSMKQCIETLETILDPNRTGHKIRINMLYQRALEWDAAHPIKTKLNKGSGSSSDAEEIKAYMNGTKEILEASYQGTNQTVHIIEQKEQNSDNNRTMVYMMLGIAALFLLKD